MKKLYLTFFSLVYAVLGFAADDAGGSTIGAIYPEPDTKTGYNIFSYPEIQIVIAQEGSVNLGECTLFYNTASGEASVDVDWKEIESNTGPRIDVAVKKALDSVKESMKDSSIFTVLISNPTIDGKPFTGKYLNADGNVELVYRFEKQTAIVEVSYPDPFLSFWPEDSREGLMTFTFDGPLMPLDQQSENLGLQIHAGPYVDGADGNGWPELPGAPFSIDGNVLTVDLRGVQRITDFSTVTVLIHDLVDARGRSVDYYGSGNIYVWNIPYIQLKAIDLVAEFTPYSGSLKGVDEIEVWVAAESFLHVDITGFRFSAEGSLVDWPVSLDATNPTADPLEPGSMIYTVEVPEGLDTVPNVTLSATLVPKDGNEYVLQAVYNTDLDEPDQPGEDNAVEAINADIDDQPVFTVSGICLRKKLSELPAGLYIRRGKKVQKTN